MSLNRVAVLGLGTMGQGMASNLLSAGFQVVAYNRTPGRAESLREQGAEVAADPARASADADALVACVSDDAALEAVLVNSGVLDHASENTMILDTGTTSLELTEQLAQRARERNLSFLDAPVTGSKLGAEGGTLTFMVGGAASDLARARPLFEAMGRYVVHAGERPGDGQRVKHCLNMTQAIVLQGVLEGYALAAAQGIPMEALAEVFENSAGKTGVGTFKTPYLKRGDFAPHFRLDLMQKDLHLALSQAARHRVPLPLSRAVSTVYDQAARQGLGAEDFLATAKLLGLTA